MNPPAPNAVKDLVQSEQFLYTVGVLAAVLLAGAIVIHLLDRWRKKQLEPEDPRTETLSLSHYRELFEAGELTHGEYEKIRDRLAAKIKGAAGSPPPPPPAVGGGPDPT